jgi:hypothetical protein
MSDTPDPITAMLQMAERAFKARDAARSALEEIIRIKDDTLGPRGGLTPLEGQKHFDRGCRMAFYRCADIAKRGLGTDQ